MNESAERKDVKGKPTGRRRSCLGCLGRAAPGLVIFLVIIPDRFERRHDSG